MVRGVGVGRVEVGGVGSRGVGVGGWSWGGWGQKVVVGLKFPLKSCS